MTERTLTTLVDCSARRASPRLSDRRLQLLFFAIALALYLPGLWWGLPHATAPERIAPWGSDELAPLGAIGELYRVFVDSEARFSAQYPLFQYMLQFVLVAPYLAWLHLTGGLAGTATTYPYGLADPVASLAVLTLLHRAVNVVMAGGVVVAALHTGTTLWGRRAGVIAAVLALLGYHMFYYSRTSNVDMGALFWTALGLAIFATVLKGGVTNARAAALGAAAALATATKDPSAFAFLPLAVPIAVWQWRAGRGAGERRAATRPVLVGIGTGAAVYAIASGFVFDPGRYASHIRFIAASSKAFIYPSSLEGYLHLLYETATYILASVGVPGAILGLLGVMLCWRDRPAHTTLALAALGILVGTILPFRFVNFRFVMIIAYVLTLFAAYTLDRLLRQNRAVGRGAGAAALLLAVLWSVVQAADLTVQMLRDSRYAVAEWIAANVDPGQSIAYFGSPGKLPALPASIRTVQGEELCTREDWTGAGRPDFVVVIPQQQFELVHEWTLPDHVYRALEDGSLGYERVLWHRGPALSSWRIVSFVNPPVQLFAASGQVAGRPAPGPVSPPRPLLSGLEQRLGLTPWRPDLLVRSPRRDAPFTCEAEW